MKSKWLISVAAAVLMLVVGGCAAQVEDRVREEVRAQQGVQETSDQLQRDHRSASERLDREVR